MERASLCVVARCASHLASPLFFSLCMLVIVFEACNAYRSPERKREGLVRPPLRRVIRHCCCSGV
ncbi:uncharacterized protein K452DRAFT_286388 [Aplosporella prunicola CBS 121167]|uniref:Uncharacterized protein n=1 Tax=Aplosporella prunicola CBS 121167 TaxID=1176127 RepID=A0A6A6BIU7_9PEZI|nr:uncharacterized protein K452DRAFT_286388 [Aplosporella prunicola CBS 121167]KAF2142757.1 hypothetical protein K452DRAFT_286388 [Aplosporella prunicola CBS 121167]